MSDAKTLPTVCPCGRADQRARPLPYAQCCGRFLDDFENTPAPDPESLMRSRYSAFALERDDYLLATWHPDKRPAEVAFKPDERWLGLDVRARSMTDGEHAQVEFVARHRDAAGKAHRLHERSRFVRQRDARDAEDAPARWYYFDGDPA